MKQKWVWIVGEGGVKPPGGKEGKRVREKKVKFPSLEWESI